MTNETNKITKGSIVFSSTEGRYRVTKINKDGTINLGPLYSMTKTTLRNVSPLGFKVEDGSMDRESWMMG
jgi:hypothetical protein